MTETTQIFFLSKKRFKTIAYRVYPPALKFFCMFSDAAFVPVLALLPLFKLYSSRHDPTPPFVAYLAIAGLLGFAMLDGVRILMHLL